MLHWYKLKNIYITIILVASLVRRCNICCVVTTYNCVIVSYDTT